MSRQKNNKNNLKLIREDFDTSDPMVHKRNKVNKHSHRADGTPNYYYKKKKLIRDDADITHIQMTPDMMEMSVKFAEMMGGMPKSSTPKTTYKEILKSKDENGVSLDAHSWCEDEFGNVVFDPGYDDEEELTKRMFNLTDEKVYKAFEPMLQKICLKATEKQKNYMFKKIAEVNNFDNELETAKRIVFLAEKGQLFGNCFIVAQAYKICNPFVNVVVGSAGWKGKDGEPHYEYG